MSVQMCRCSNSVYTCACMRAHTWELYDAVQSFTLLLSAAFNYEFHIQFVHSMKSEHYSLRMFYMFGCKAFGV